MKQLRFLPIALVSLFLSTWAMADNHEAEGKTETTPTAETTAAPTEAEAAASTTATRSRPLPKVRQGTPLKAGPGSFLIPLTIGFFLASTFMVVLMLFYKEKDEKHTA